MNRPPTPTARDLKDIEAAFKFTALSVVESTLAESDTEERVDEDNNDGNDVTWAFDSDGSDNDIEGRLSSQHGVEKHEHGVEKQRFGLSDKRKSERSSENTSRGHNGAGEGELCVSTESDDIDRAVGMKTVRLRETTPHVGSASWETTPPVGSASWETTPPAGSASWETTPPRESASNSVHSIVTSKNSENGS